MKDKTSKPEPAAGQPAARGRLLDAAILAPLLLAHLLLGTFAVNRQAATYDEGVHLASGYNYLVTGSYSVDKINQPPLLRVLSALPLLALKPDPFSERPEAKGEAFAFADLFIYHNRLPPDRLLAAGRMALFWTLAPLLGVLIYFSASALAGRAAGAAALFLYALCPVMLGNGPLIMTDFGLTVFSFAALAALHRALTDKKDSAAVTVLFGLALGCALASKISAVLLLGIIPCSIAAYRLLTGDRAVLGRGARVFGAGLAVAAAVVLLSYRFGQAGMFWDTVRWKFTETEQGVRHIAYLLGYTSDTGWWYYFPACFLLKTPLLTLLLLGLAAFLCLERFTDAPRGTPGGWRAHLAACPWAPGGGAAVIAFFLLPPALWLAAACTSKLQIGLRHILPVYPFCFAAAGAAAAGALRSPGLLRRACLWLLAAGYAWSALSAYPDYLTVFNRLVPDRTQAFRYLADANLDTGQGLKELGRYLAGRGSPPIYLSYFGNADPHAYGISYVPVSMFGDVQRKGDFVKPFEAERILFAVSASNRAGMYYHNPKLMYWLEKYRPAAVVGNSIYVYDFTGEGYALGVIGRILQLQEDKRNTAALLEWYVRNGYASVKD